MTHRAPLPDSERLIKVSLLTGYLGSGKTTLLNALLKRDDMGHTAVLVNEFGDIAIDHHLIERLDATSMMLTSGCLCCAMPDDLTRALQDLAYKQARGDIPPIRRVLIETTGLADPAPIIHSLMAEPVSDGFALDAVIATVDAVHGATQLDQHVEAVRQAAMADRLLLTKVDLAEADQGEALTERLRAINPSAPLFWVTHGDIEPAKLFDAGLYDPATRSLDVQRWLGDEAVLAAASGEHDHAHHDPVDHAQAHARHDARIASWCLIAEAPLDWQAFVAWVHGLIGRHGEQLLRVKGIVNIAGEAGPVAVHGVQHLFHQPTYLPAWPDGDRRSRIVLIGIDLTADVVADLRMGLTRAAAKITS